MHPAAAAGGIPRANFGPPASPKYRNRVMNLGFQIGMCLEVEWKNAGLARLCPLGWRTDGRGSGGLVCGRRREMERGNKVDEIALSR